MYREDNLCSRCNLLFYVNRVNSKCVINICDNRDSANCNNCRLREGKLYQWEYFNEKIGRWFDITDTLIDGENCDEAHATALVELLKGLPCHVNLIRLNEVKERTLKATSDKAAYRFLGMLEKGGLSATLRRQIGVDIGGACGQLRAQYMEENQ